MSVTSWRIIGARIEDTLAGVFGHKTPEFYRDLPGSLDPTPSNYQPFADYSDPSIYERRPYIKKVIASAISTFNSAISMIRERG
jgi:hypothetical protein